MRLSLTGLSPALLALCALFTACGDVDPNVRPTATRADVGGDGLLADAGCMTCAGATMPTWRLSDVQPKSAGYGKTYGLEAFKGKVTVVALLASW